MRRVQTIFPGILVVSALSVLLGEANLILISPPPPHKNIPNIPSVLVTESVPSIGTTPSMKEILSQATSTVSSMIFDFSSTLISSLTSESGSSTPSSTSTGPIITETAKLEQTATGHISTEPPLDITSTYSSTIHDISSTIPSSLTSESGSSTPTSTNTGNSATSEEVVTGHISTEPSLDISSQTSPSEVTSTLSSIAYDISSTIVSTFTSESGSSTPSTANIGNTAASEEAVTGHISTEVPQEITSQTAPSEMLSTSSLNSVSDTSSSSFSTSSFEPRQDATFPATDTPTPGMQSSPRNPVSSSGETSVLSSPASEPKVEFVKLSIVPPFRALLTTQTS